MKEYGRTYSASALSQRFAIFSANLDAIEQHNTRAAADGLTYTLGITEHADMSPSEYSKFPPRLPLGGAVIRGSGGCEVRQRRVRHRSPGRVHGLEGAERGGVR